MRFFRRRGYTPAEREAIAAFRSVITVHGVDVSTLSDREVVDGIRSLIQVSQDADPLTAIMGAFSRGDKVVRAIVEAQARDPDLTMRSLVSDVRGLVN